MSDVQKKDAIDSIAKIVFDATNQAAHAAVGNKSLQIKRQSSSTNINETDNSKKLVTNHDGRSTSLSIFTDTEDN